jgi:hypothetical protein
MRSVARDGPAWWVDLNCASKAAKSVPAVDALLMSIPRSPRPPALLSKTVSQIAGEKGRFPANWGSVKSVRLTDQCRMLIAREITSARSTNPVTAWYPMSAFARVVIGMTSVGLNAIMFESEKYP